MDHSYHYLSISHSPSSTTLGSSSSSTINSITSSTYYLLFIPVSCLLSFHFSQSSLVPSFPVTNQFPLLNHNIPISIPSTLNVVPLPHRTSTQDTKNRFCASPPKPFTDPVSSLITKTSCLQPSAKKESFDSHCVLSSPK